MKCLVKNVDDEAFLEYLIKKIRDYAMSNVNINLLNSYKDIIVELYPELKNINMLYFFNASFNILLYKKYEDDYIIEFNNKKTCFGTNITIYEICNLINYGTRDIKPYPIFSQAFNYVTRNMSTIKYLYDRGM